MFLEALVRKFISVLVSSGHVVLILPLNLAGIRKVFKSRDLHFPAKFRGEAGLVY